MANQTSCLKTFAGGTNYSFRRQISQSVVTAKKLFERHIQRGGQTRVNGGGCTHAGKAWRRHCDRITTHGNPTRTESPRAVRRDCLAEAQLAAAKRQCGARGRRSAASQYVSADLARRGNKDLGRTWLRYCIERRCAGSGIAQPARLAGRDGQGFARVVSTVTSHCSGWRTNTPPTRLRNTDSSL